MVPSAIKPLRSVESRQKCKLQFYNISKRDVQIVWLGFEGEEVEYKILKPKRVYVMNSYVTHPWIFRDHQRHNLMVANVYRMKKEHFVAIMTKQRPFETLIGPSCRILYPSAHEQGEVLHVRITDGVYSLRELCYQALHGHNMPNLNSSAVPRAIAQEFEDYCNGQKVAQAQL